MVLWVPPWRRNSYLSSTFFKHASWFPPFNHSAGILWNLSSSDNLKDRLARDTLEQLTDLILIPLSGSGSAALIQQNASEAEIFYNATGFLRYLGRLTPPLLTKPNAYFLDSRSWWDLFKKALHGGESCVSPDWETVGTIAFTWKISFCIGKWPML